jgi:hypothetical protein
VQYLDYIKQANVVYSRAGGGAGSIILMKFHKENSEFTLMIHCAWRIENNNKVIATSAGDTNAITGIVARGAKMLEGKVVSSMEMSSFYDLCIKFEDGFCIKTFSDITYYNILSASRNWSFSIPHDDISFDITKGFKIRKGKYYSND